MATVESWAVDLANLGPVYPMVGSEGILLVIGLVIWIGWHIIQGVSENRAYEEDLKKLNTPEKVKRAMEERRLD